jgi:hypothetical protein
MVAGFLYGIIAMSKQENCLVGVPVGTPTSKHIFGILPGRADHLAVSRVYVCELFVDAACDQAEP